MKKGLIIFIVIIGVIAIIGASFAGAYNTLVAESQSVESKLKQIDVVLQNRADQIPNLVSVVKGFASHELEAINSVTDARARLAGAGSVADKANADANLSGALSRLLVVAENYPTLKADSNFNSLMDNISGLENRISVARTNYNDAVKTYNTKIKSFPTNIISGMFGFAPAEYFEATSYGAKEVPKVDFTK